MDNLEPIQQGYCSQPSNCISLKDCRICPHFVSSDLTQCLEICKSLKPQYLLLFELLVETGMRISDLLNLTYDDCLTRTEKHFFLTGTSRKTKRPFRVPISNSLANELSDLIEGIKEQSNEKNNPSKLLFVVFKDGQASPILFRNLQEIYKDQLYWIKVLLDHKVVRHTFLHSLKIPKLSNQGDSE